MPNGERLPDEIVLTFEEARTVLFALDAGIGATPAESRAHRALDEAADILVAKFLPDLRDL